MLLQGQRPKFQQLRHVYLPPSPHALVIRPIQGCQDLPHSRACIVGGIPLLCRGTRPWRTRHAQRIPPSSTLSSSLNRGRPGALNGPRAGPIVLSSYGRSGCSPHSSCSRDLAPRGGGKEVESAVVVLAKLFPVSNTQGDEADRRRRRSLEPNRDARHFLAGAGPGLFHRLALHRDRHASNPSRANSKGRGVSKQGHTLRGAPGKCSSAVHPQRGSLATRIWLRRAPTGWNPKRKKSESLALRLWSEEWAGRWESKHPADSNPPSAHSGRSRDVSLGGWEPTRGSGDGRQATKMRFVHLSGN